MSETWTIKAALDWTVDYLTRKGDENPRVSAEWLMSEATGLSRIELYVSFDKPLSMEERDVLRDYVKRRGAGEPLQYITGQTAFRYITVKVRPGVLIPRPETEVLVSVALSLLPTSSRRHALDSSIDAWEGDLIRTAQQQMQAAQENQAENEADQIDSAISDLTSELQGLTSSVASDVAPVEASTPRPLLVADICTGSGCIACSIAHERPDTHLFATDISPVAVSLARENAEALELADRVRVEQGDLGAPMPATALGKLDLVVSNPPYIPSAVLAEIPKEVTDFEPALALDGGTDGNDILRRLLPWTFDALRPGGAFAFELHETCLDAAAELARAAGFVQVEITNDLADKPRVLSGRKPV